MPTWTELREFALTYQAPLATLDQAEFTFPLAVLTSVADQLEEAHIGDDVAVLTAAGYPVVVGQQATRRDLVEAVGAEATAGFYWSSHGGEDGHLQCCDGDEVRPADLDPATASPGLRLVVLGACYVGAHAAAWRTALGDRPLVTGWGRPVTLDRAVDFLDAGHGLDHLIKRWLLTDAPIPPAPDPGSVPPPIEGRTTGLHDRVRDLAHLLGAE